MKRVLIIDDEIPSHVDQKYRDNIIPSVPRRLIILLNNEEAQTIFRKDTQ